MLHFSANLSVLFDECNFFARFEKAAQCGFHGVELIFPYDYDIKELRQILVSNGLEHTLHNLPTGDWVTGEWGIAYIPGREEEFRNGIAATIHYARALGSKEINCLVGKAPANFSSERIYTTLVEGLRYIVNMLMRKDILLLIEPINYLDILGFHLTGTRWVLRLIDNIGRYGLGIQYNIYHIQRVEGELTSTMAQWAGKIDRPQTADNPHRGESGTGEVNYEYSFAVIENSGHDGWVDYEYKPQTTTEADLRWMDPCR